MTLQELIDKVEYDFKYYDNPGMHEDSAYYDKCKAKADYAEEILSYLKELKAAQL